MTKKAASPLFDLSRCVRCGACKVLCPTFMDDPSEPLGARGRIALIREFEAGRLKPSPLLKDRIFNCILCGACAGTCPLGLDIPGTVLAARAKLADSDRKRWLIRKAVRLSLKWPDTSFMLARFGRHLVGPLLARQGLIPFAPELPDIQLRKTGHVFKAPKKRGRVAIFIGCVTNYITPHLGESLIHLLHTFGYEVVLPKGEVCCGSPLRAMGLEEEAIRKAKKNLRVFNRLKVDAVLSLCPTCTHSIRNDYSHMIGDGIEKAIDLSVFFKEIIGPADPIGKTAVFHDPCHLRYGLGIKKEPRELLKGAGMDIVEQKDSGCCGLGGVFSLSFGDISGRLLASRAGSLKATGADIVVTSCPGCILQLGRAITDRPLLHLVEVLEEAYCFRTSSKEQMKAAAAAM